MKPVDQTRKGHNCFSACLASILEVGIEDVPNFRWPESNKTHIGQVERAEKWLRNKYGCTVVELFDVSQYLGYPSLEVTKETYQFPTTYYIMTGWVNLKKEKVHAVVGLQGEMVHDPHPKRAGLVHVFTYTFLVPVDAVGDFGRHFYKYNVLSG